MEADKIINQYVKEFGELPPRDVVVSYYEQFYLDLMIEAIESGKPITPEQLDEAIGNQPYDYVLPDERKDRNKETLKKLNK